MIVMKFGGTSVEDAKAMRGAVRIVREHLGRNPIVVSSACAGVTTALLRTAKDAVGGETKRALDQVEVLRIRHRKIAHDLFTPDLLFTVQSQLDAMLDELRDLARSIAILGELTDRSLDIFASFGERLSTLLLYHHMKQEGINCVLINAQEVIITTGEFTRATPLMELIEQKANTVLRPRIESGQVVVTQGFLGATEAGIPTTIGRGGSDYSAAIIGAALNAEEIQIWTDVDGILTCDPTVVKGARLIKEITFREAAELAFFGAKVLHPSTIIPAVKKNIPVRVLNAKHPLHEGTVILREIAGPHPDVKAIAFKRGIILINITSTRMLGMHGFLARVFEIFAQHEKSVDVIATSEVSLSLTVDSEQNLGPIFDELRSVAEIDIARQQAIFCVVGEKLKKAKGIFARIFAALDSQNVSVNLISLGASEINVTFVVDEQTIPVVAHELHREFFETKS